MSEVIGCRVFSASIEHKVNHPKIQDVQPVAHGLTNGLFTGL